ncbi:MULTISPECIES: hypothetical protein [Thermoactinomyces]|uniref:DUF2269 family protein n=1 Tax=Thermoactinomyces daqus TaxID=1329516 RepID=A0A7W1XCS2_9BACL|nr:MULTISPECIES: hypothetical protein [Thermoactinomyces]MBA4544193.1 hypothetical protein [Thermoactinomyces daqus]MBH8597954.1 hypothetical protein [Thermoactinomyces sp. CICC 10523]MBH8607763.1 hypothetical protein [Thermoactinomyces sp. CICC 10521]
MLKIMLFFHVLGAIGMGFYLVLPFLLQKRFLQSRSVLQVLYRLNFLTQWILVVQLLTGGYLYSQAVYSTLWISLVVAAYFGVGAFGGLFGYYIRHFLKSPDRFEVKSWMQTVRFHALFTTAFIFLVILLMMFPAGI